MTSRQAGLFKRWVPRFYFIVHDEWGEAPDDEGAELLNVEAALIHAATGVRSIVCEGIKKGLLDLTGSIQIADQHGAEIARLPFGEAFKIRM